MAFSVSSLSSRFGFIVQTDRRTESQTELEEHSI